MDEDKIKLAMRLIARAAKQKWLSGLIPTVLGPRGMLAQMFENIAKFSEAQEDQSTHVLDLAVNAIFAFALSLPDMDIPDADEIPDDDPLPEAPDDGNEQADREEGPVDPRWTPIPGGTPLPSVVNKLPPSITDTPSVIGEEDD